MIVTEIECKIATDGELWRDLIETKTDTLWEFSMQTSKQTFLDPLSKYSAVSSLNFHL